MTSARGPAATPPGRTPSAKHGASRWIAHGVVPRIAVRVWLLASLAISAVVSAVLVAAAWPMARLLDVPVLSLYVAGFHALLLVPVLCLAALTVPRRPSPTSASVRRWLWGFVLGALVAINGIMAWPVTYGPLTTRHQPFATPLGLWTVGLLAVAPWILGKTAMGWGTAEPSGRRRSWIWAGLFLVTAVAHQVAESTDPSGQPSVPSGAAVSKVSRPEDGLKVALVGFDGLSWNVISALLERGEMPELRRFLARGSHGALVTDEPTLSPAIWTTIATGRAPAEHGIHAFSLFQLPGLMTPIGHGPSMSTPNWWCGINRVLLGARNRGWIADRMYTSLDRRVPALWDLADHHGVSAGMAGWLASRPVTMPRHGGFRAADLRLRSPAILPAAENQDVVGGQFPMPELETPPGLDPFVASLWRRAHEDVHKSLALIDRYDPRLLALYSRFPDPVQHHVWRGDAWLLGDGSFDPDQLPADLLASYRQTDRLLGAVLRALGDDRIVFLVSDHGFRFDGRQHHHAPPGVIAVAGPGVRTGIVLDGVTIYDLFPTLANLLDLPVPPSLRGRVLGELFAPGALPPRRLAEDESWYDPTAGREDDPIPWLDDQELRELRSLGYVN